jgi:D-alanine-D-alanine ligase
MEKRFSSVAVLKGGVSSEREVSLRSGAAIAAGLRDGGYDVIELDIRTTSFTVPDGIEAVFVALHGEFGEDGEIQRALMDRGIPFTGSGADSSRVSFDKILTRERLTEHGIPVPQGEVIRMPGDRTIPFPLVVKPPREGSSVGCHIVHDEAHWEAAFSDAAGYSDEVLVEEYIPGRELTVGVIEHYAANGERRLQVLPVVEIRPAVEWYDYEAKYVTGDTEYVCPAILESAVEEELQSIALNTFQALDAEGFGRIDFRLSPERKPYVLELNAIPGFTSTSLLPKAAQAAGIGFSALCCHIMEMADL